MADDKSRLAFLDAFARLLNSSTHSDITIIVKSATFRAHKAILEIRTSFFTTATLTENGFVDLQEQTVTLQEHSPYAVWRFLTYCYTGNYSAESDCPVIPSAEDDGHTHLVHPRVYALADMLGVESLKTLAVKQLQKQLEGQQIKAEAYPSIIMEIYSTTSTQNKDIRDAIIQATKVHVKALEKDEDFKVVISEYPDFAIGLMAFWDACSRCTRCKRSCRYWCNYCVGR
ncbi:hypothetical protein K440DRAFT_43594 [Wilcoxina mikolae CBS 423.85]|nr:hypothetical protein K440DRAFT_43594 [Wilcoxina mikolae CBS 423.85]